MTEDRATRLANEQLRALTTLMVSMGNVPKDLERIIKSILATTKNAASEYEEELRLRNSSEDDISRKRREVLMDLRRREEELEEAVATNKRHFEDASQALADHNDSLERARAVQTSVNDVLTQLSNDKSALLDKQQENLETVENLKIAMEQLRNNFDHSNGAVFEATEAYRNMIGSINQHESIAATYNSELNRINESIAATDTKLVEAGFAVRSFAGHVKKSERKIAELATVTQKLSDAQSAMRVQRPINEKELLNPLSIASEHATKGAKKFWDQFTSPANISNGMKDMFAAIKAEITSQIGMTLGNYVSSALLGLSGKEYAELSAANRDVVVTLGGTTKHLEALSTASDMYLTSIGDLTERTKFIQDQLTFMGEIGIRPSVEAMRNLQADYDKTAKRMGLTTDKYTAVMQDIMNTDGVQQALRSADTDAERERIRHNINARLIEGQALYGTTKKAIEAAKALGQIGGQKTLTKIQQAIKMQTLAASMGVKLSKDFMLGYARLGTKNQNLAERKSIEEQLSQIQTAYEKTQGTDNLSMGILYGEIGDKLQILDKLQPFSSALANAHTYTEANTKALGEVSDTMKFLTNAIQQANGLGTSGAAKTVGGSVGWAINTLAVFGGLAGAKAAFEKLTGKTIASLMPVASQYFSKAAPYVGKATAGLAVAGAGYEAYVAHENDQLSENERSRAYGKAAGMAIGGVLGSIVGGMYTGGLGTIAAGAGGTAVGGLIGEKIGGMFGSMDKPNLGTEAPPKYREESSKFGEPSEQIDSLSRINDKLALLSTSNKILNDIHQRLLEQLDLQQKQLALTSFGKEDQLSGNALAKRVAEMRGSNIGYKGILSS